MTIHHHSAIVGVVVVEVFDGCGSGDGGYIPRASLKTTTTDAAVFIVVAAASITIHILLLG